uniref:Repressor of RNA polymerase III transcription MAF1 homolog n=1 Tax=Ascaris suum TaxID=6253 RepID=F1LBK7_ASCSU
MGKDRNHCLHQTNRLGRCRSRFFTVEGRRLSRFRHLSEPSCSGSDNDTDEAGCVYLHAVTTRTLFDLVGVLNTSFPDYDFSHIKSESFSLIPNLSSLIGLVDLKLSATVSNYNEIKEALWREIDEVIKVNDCKIYSYQTEYTAVIRSVRME